MRLKAFIITLLIMVNGQNYSNADEAKSGINFYTGMFDFSDDKKRSTLFGIEHQDENLYRDTFLGRVSPVTGMMITADNATYLIFLKSFKFKNYHEFERLHKFQ